MTNRSKARGTAFESLVRGYLQGDGWNECERLPLHGAADKGDLVICTQPFRVHAECKAGATANAASPALIDNWLDEADRERRAATAVLCPLIVYKYRANVTNHDVWLPLKHLVWLEVGVYGGSDIPVRMALGDFSALLRYAVGEWEAGDRP